MQRLFEVYGVTIAILSLSTCVSTTDQRLYCQHPPTKPLVIAINPHVATKGEKNIIIHPSLQFAYLQLPGNENFTKNTLIPAIKFWQTVLKRKEASPSPLMLERNCVNRQRHKFVTKMNVTVYGCEYDCESYQMCGSVYIPQNLLKMCITNENSFNEVKPTLKQGIPGADYILFVDSNLCSSNEFGTGMVCQMEHKWLRPIGGLISICPILLDASTNQKQAYLAVIHMLAHALGFDEKAYAYMVDVNGKTRTSGVRDSITSMEPQYHDLIPDESVLKRTSMRWETARQANPLSFKRLLTPKLRDAARKHFACPDLAGVPMESQTSMANHFEKRFVGDEIMSGSIWNFAPVSQLTLAFFEDAGWYKVATNFAEELTWGDKLGCDFVEKSCYIYMKMQKQRNASILPWCDRVNPRKGVCTLQNGACCNLIKERHPVSVNYQYFEDSYIRGNDRLSDYCPYEYIYNQTFRNSVTPRVPKRIEHQMIYLILLPLSFILVVVGLIIFPIAMYSKLKNTKRRISRIDEYCYADLANRRTTGQFSAPIFL